MEALVPAFLLALLAQPGEKPALLTAMLADRFRRPLLVALAAGLGHALANGFAALGGGAVAFMLPPRAASLMLAIALVSASISGFWSARPPKRHEEWRLGAWLTPMLATFSLAIGGTTPFFTFALAAGGMAWFAFAGATLGAFAVTLVAAMLGEAGWQALPLGAFRAVSAMLFLIAGLYLALRVFALIG